MRITSIGHAGLLVETRHGTVLCDPWFTPAYFASWFPFPSNEDIDPASIGSPDYLYVSHLHRDHFDPAFLARHVSRDATVILPDFPVDHLRTALEDLGFHRFLPTRNGEPVEVDGLRIATWALTAPVDGPLGDSGLIVDDGETRLYNQNDSRPVDLDPLLALGPFDVHLLQYSGAIWYPMVYRFPARAKETLGRKKRENQMARALRYAEQIGARHVVPFAGPPCFLDPALYHLNDVDNDPANIFPDQRVFLDYMRAHGMSNGVLLIPGSTLEVEGDGRAAVRHALPDAGVARIFDAKRDYLDAYAARRRHEVDAVMAALPDSGPDLFAAVRDWFEPLMADGDLTCANVGTPVVLMAGERPIVLDFPERRVTDGPAEPWRYRLHVDPRLLRSVVERHVEDWVNELFLSCRFEAERRGPFNEHIYNFFKCLSKERLQYLEGYYAERSNVDETFECAGYRIQRRCPHLRGDLTRFGQVEDGVLTCTLHGWQFELSTGRCLTSDDRRLRSEPLDGDAARDGAVAV